MELETITETRKAAVEKWHEYVAAEKIYRKPEFKDLKNIYNQIKGGRKVVDIFKVIQKGGQHGNLHPKLAVACANTKKVICRFSSSGRVSFGISTWQDRKDVIINDCFPRYDAEKILGDRFGGFNLEAPVPIVPPRFLPKKLTDDYYILWEVDEWKKVAPTDPYLLKRITKNVFVVLAGWDLTPLEKAVMSGRMI